MHMMCALFISSEQSLLITLKYLFKSVSAEIELVYSSKVQT